MTEKKSTKTRLVHYSGWLVAVAAFTVNADIHPEAIQHFLSEAAQNQITQAGFFFTMAAWIHSGRVKKEIKANFEILTQAINNVADSLREDLKSQSGQIHHLATRVTILESITKETENA